MGKKKRKRSSKTPLRSKKFKRVDVAAKKSEDRFYRTYSIKCTLGRFCKYKTVQKEIEECVYWMSRLQIHSHHVMTLWLVRNRGIIPLGDRKEHKSKSLQGLYDKIMRHLANHLQRRKERKDVDNDIRDLCVEYCEGVGLADWPSGISLGWKSKVLEQMARQSATMHTTHLETNLDIFAVRYLRFLIRSDSQFSTIRDLSKKAYGKVFSAISDAFWDRKKITAVVKRRPETLKIFPVKHDIWKVAQQLVGRLMKLVPKRTSLSKKSEIIFQILSELEPFAADLQQKFLNGETSKSVFGKSKWTFDLCPQLEWRPKHIHISTTALNQLLRDLSKSHSHFKSIVSGLNDVDDDETCAYETKYRVWNSVFDLKRVLRAKHLRDHTKIRFGCFMSTDGVSVAATIQERKSKDACKVINIGDEIKFIKDKVWLLFCGQWAVKSLTRVAPKGIIMPLRHRDIQVPTHSFVFFYPWMKTLEAKKERLLREIDHRNDQTLIHKDLKDLVKLKKDEDGVYHSETTIVGLDPGKKSAATWVCHSPEHQKKHQKWKGGEGEHTAPEERYESDSLGGGEWRFLSGQKQFTSKMNKRMLSFCPQWRNLPSTKTTDWRKLLNTYQEQMALWDQLEKAFFNENKWYQKQKMRKFCRHQKAMEDVVSRICGTKKKDEQKKVVIAYGDGDKNGTLRGTAPIMSTKLFKKVSQSCCVVVINEFRTSKLCSCCHQPMDQFQKQFRMKRCNNSDCIRSVWDRDVNASVNILNLFLELCHSAKEDGKGHRPKAFTR